MNARIHQFAHQPGCLAIRGAAVDAQPHSHKALQLIIPTNSLNFRLELDTKQLNLAQPMVIGSQVRHALQANEVLLLLVEPSSQLGKVLKSQLLGNNDYFLFDAAQASLRSDSQLNANDIEKCLSLLGLPYGRAFQLEARIVRLFEHVQRKFGTGDGDQVNLAWAADQVHLSASRLQHVFSEQVGMPWRAWLLWQRLLHAAFAAAAGNSLSEAAMAAGFADAAHFSRTFKANFGVVPSAIVLDAHE